MKKIWLLLGVAVLLLGCAKQENQKGPVRPEATKEEVPDPMTEVEGAQAFAKVGADIEAPAGAEDARYYIIAERIAEIQFMQNGVQYSYRAARTEENVTGMRTETQELEDARAVVGSREIPIQIAGNSYVAIWRWGDISYGLIARDSADGNVMKSLVEELARDTMPAQV